MAAAAAYGAYVLSEPEKREIEAALAGMPRPCKCVLLAPHVAPAAALTTWKPPLRPLKRAHEVATEGDPKSTAAGCAGNAIRSKIASFRRTITSDHHCETVREWRRARWRRRCADTGRTHDLSRRPVLAYL